MSKQNQVINTQVIKNQPSQETSDWIRSFFAKTTIPRMSKEKIERILADHESKNKKLKTETAC